jgi:hypothetical protein
MRKYALSAEEFWPYLEIMVQYSANMILFLIFFTASFVPIRNKRKGIRILTLDGGGTRGLVSIEMLKMIEKISGTKVSFSKLSPK